MPKLTDLELTTTFLTVAQERSFSKSAERLRIDQSALTRRIQRLEHALGFRLFERTTRDVWLTPAGKVFFEDNLELATSFSRSVERARLVAQGRAGELRVGYMTFAASDLMPKTVLRFRRDHPAIAVNLEYRRTQAQKLEISKGSLDIGFMIGPFEHVDFETRFLRREPLVVLMPCGHDLARRATIEPRHMNGMPMIMGAMGEWDAYRWQLEEMFAAQGVDLRVEFEATNALALFGLVKAGLGVTVYPDRPADFAGFGLESRSFADDLFAVSTILCWKRTNASSLARRFADCAGLDEGDAYPMRSDDPA